MALQIFAKQVAHVELKNNFFVLNQRNYQTNSLQV